MQHAAICRLTIHRDSEASAPAEFPPEQPEADLVADGDQYGAEEAEEEAAEEAEALGTSKESDDAAMAGVEGEAAEHDNEEDEMSEDGSVDLEGESEDELEEEEEEEGEGEGQEGAEDDAMEVDEADKPSPAAQVAHQVSVAS